MTGINTRCPICNGYKSESTTTFTVDLDFGVVVVRHVPATVCEQCGAEWIDDNNAEQLDQIVNYAKQKHTMVEVLEFSSLKKEAS
jgi:YgiT-type zinc finger domain-containing protein